MTSVECFVINVELTIEIYVNVGHHYRTADVVLKFCVLRLTSNAQLFECTTNNMANKRYLYSTSFRTSFHSKSMNMAQRTTNCCRCARRLSRTVSRRHTPCTSTSCTTVATRTASPPPSSPRRSTPTSNDASPFERRLKSCQGRFGHS